ncbi:MAG: c-type cytochrome [Anaerolineales bacterium]|nr:c-type cytochrome [Anaerolineales bacterium]
MTPKHLAFIACLALAISFGAFSHVAAQEPDPIPTPIWPTGVEPSAVEGAIIYDQRCARCHGDLGLGDGEMAAQSIQPPTAIGDPAYLRTADPTYMFSVIQNGNLEAGMPGFGEGNNSDPLNTADIWNVIAAVYGLPAASQPLDTAVISGQLTNASNGTPVGNLTVTLQAFTPDAVEALALETVADADGNYQFDLTRVPPNWIYRTVVNYGALDYSSDFARLTADDSAVALPITIYETTSDTAVIRVAELDSVLEFVGEATRISELYTISNMSERVFVGPDGTAEDITLYFSVPAGASNVQFLRGGATANDFFPLDEQIVPTADNEYGLTVPIPPGEGIARVLVQYELPFERGMTISRPIAYPLDTVTLIVANGGVTLRTDDNWALAEVASDTLTADVRVYQRPALAAGESLAYTLAGFPTAVVDTQGNQLIVRDEETELVVGVLVLLVTAVGVLFVGYRWTQSPPPESEHDLLIQTLAALDEAYAAQRIRKSSYDRQRQETKERLLAIWQDKP